MQRTDLIDTDGENKAIRSFLKFYLKPGISIGEMRDNMEMAGWDGCWPDSIGAADWSSTLTKFEAQAWLRHLFGFEAQFAAPSMDVLEVRADSLPDYARDQAGAGLGMSRRDVDAVDTRWEREHQALIGNPAITVVARLAPPAGASAAGMVAEGLVAKRLERIRTALLVASNTNRVAKIQPSDAAMLVDAVGGSQQVSAVTTPATTLPIPLHLNCPECGVAHVDEGEWATRLHKTHQCQACKHEWRPYEYPTVGVVGNADVGRIEALCRVFMEGIEHGTERDGANSTHADPALAAAYILGYDMAANPGTLVGALVEDRRLLEWLGKNFTAGTLDDFDHLTIKNSDKWEFLAPKGVRSDIREVLRAALARDEGTAA